MKLISLYIENFGGLSRYGLNFQDGVTVVQEPNGFGKTTLAEFIRAMFYGFPRRTKILDKDKRQKFTPWNGNKAGGNLVFEYEDRRYRIERTFGSDPKGDTFQLIDLNTNQKSTRFSRDIGVELFGLDADSFERSTYMPQLHEIGILTTDSIRAKLSDLVEDTGDINNYEKAIAVLKNKRTTYLLYRGIGGTVAEAQKQIVAIQRKLDAAEGTREELASGCGEIARLESILEAKNDEISQIREQIIQVSEASAVAAIHQRHEELTAEQEEMAARFGQLRAKYPMGLPSLVEMDQIQQTADRRTMLTRQMVTSKTDLDALQGQYDDLAALYQTGRLEEAELDELTERSRQLTKRKHALESMELPQEEARLAELEIFFAEGVPEETELRSRNLDLILVRQLRQENADAMADPPSAPSEKSNPAPLILALVLGVLGVALGIALLVKREFLFGGVGLCAGILALVAAIFLGVRKMVSRELSGRVDPACQAKLDANRERIQILERKLRRFVETYTGADELSEGLHEICRKREEYLALRAKICLRDEKRDILQREIRTQEASLCDTLDGRRDYDRAILDLRLARSRYLEQMKAKLAAEERMQALRAEVEKIETQLNDFFEHWAIEQSDDLRAQLGQLRRDQVEWTHVSGRAKRLADMLAEFEADYADVLAQPKPEGNVDLNGLKRQEKTLGMEIADLTNRLLQQRQQIQHFRSAVDQIPGLRDELEQWQEQKTADQKRAQTLDAAMEFLAKAKESLAGSYLRPIQTGFAGYLQRLTGENREKILVTPDLEVRLERMGQSRELAYFSAGQTDLVMLCMRLALVDALFTDVKPFVILDDPFVNLDDVHTEKALTLLKDLAQDWQILYLTCSSSRTI